MPRNHLEQLVHEWYEYNGYFVRSNVKVGPRPQGGYEGELDIVAFNPESGEIVLVEPSNDALSWIKREMRYERKFSLGKRFIPGLFPKSQSRLDQIALLVYASKDAHGKELGGGRVCTIGGFLDEIWAKLLVKPPRSGAVPENYPLLRTIQFVLHFTELGRSNPD